MRASHTTVETLLARHLRLARRPLSAIRLAGQGTLLLAGILSTAPAAAQLIGTANNTGYDTFTPLFGIGYSYDDNLFRLAENQTPPGFERADTSRQAYAGLEFERPVGRQLFTASAKVTRVSFKRHSEIDYNGKDFYGNWAWQLGNHLSGNIGASYIEMLTPFGDYNNTDRNLRTQRGQYAELNWRFHPSWRLHTRYNHDEFDYDLTSQRYLDRKVDGGEAGIDYLAASGSTVGLQLRRVRADYPNSQLLSTGLLDYSYTQTTASLKVRWKVSGATEVLFLGGRAKRDRKAGVESSGTNGRVDVNWTVTPLVLVKGALWKQFQPFEGSGVSYSLDKGASVGATWMPRNQVKLDAELRRTKRDFEGPLTNTVLIGAADTTTLASLSATYELRRYLSLSASVFRDKREATSFYSNSYRAKGASVFVNAQF